MKNVSLIKLLMILGKSFWKTKIYNSILSKQFAPPRIMFVLGMMIFTTSSIAQDPCVSDQTASDFSLGTLTYTYISETEDGEVILNPSAGAEFSGSTVPSGWTSEVFNNNPNGATTVSNGSVTVNASHVYS